MDYRYNKKLGLKLPLLGMGMSRLPPPPPSNRINSERYKILCDFMCEVFESGINYFDTASIYMDGEAEGLIANSIVKKYSRHSFFIADKLSAWVCEEPEKYFDIQLKNTGVEYFDMYLLHSVNVKSYQKAVNSGIREFLTLKKKEGRINKIGFSFHGNAEEIDNIIDDYPWDFVQLQINYLDWKMQNAEYTYNAVLKRNLPCFVMEPLKGGLLAIPPKNVGNVFINSNSTASVASWGLRYVATLPNVALTLSGMTNTDILKDNISTFNPFIPLNQKEFAIVDKALMTLLKEDVSICTNCGYCLTVCPQKIPINNIMKMRTWSFNIENDRDHIFKAFDCISCEKCTEICTQGIKIPQEIKKRILSITPDLTTVLKAIEEKAKIVIWGSGSIGALMLRLLKNKNIFIHSFCDSNQNKWNTTVEGVPIISPNDLLSQASMTKILVVIAVSNKFLPEISRQLDLMLIASTILKIDTGND